MRDSDILKTLKTDVISTSEKWLGVGTVGRYMSEIAVCTELLYFAIALSGAQGPRQTLGEEYVSVSLANRGAVARVRRVLGSKNYVRAAAVFFPSLGKVGIYILLKVGIPYVIRCLSRLRDKSIRNRSSKSFLDSLPPLEDFWDQVIEKSHFSLFLLTSLFDDIAKRVLQLVYIRHYRADGAPPSFSKLGYLVLLHACVNAFVLVYESVRNYRPLTEVSSGTDSAAEDKVEDRCPLCLSRRRHTSCPPCGHLFCWDCLIAATQLKPECPECRQPCEPKSVLQLRNVS